MKINCYFFGRGVMGLAAGLLAMWGTASSEGAENSKHLVLEEIASGFTAPLNLLQLPDESGRLLIADQVGGVYLYEPGKGLRDKLVFDFTDRLAKLNQGFDERGVLGMALHPDFQENRRIFFYYSAPLRSGAPEDWDHTSVVSEFQMDTGAVTLAGDSERVLMEVDQPYFNHNGGRLAFGPDGYLYIAIGDGGNANDVGRGHPPEGNGQNLQTFMGKILRIDVDGEKPYAVPKDNPFVGEKEILPEIYAYGLRNPWGMTFDRGGEHELFTADVGQTMFEEVNIVTKGGNYGWNIREGRHCFDPANPKSPPEDCPEKGARGEPLVDPILEYKNLKGFPDDPEGQGISVTGGYVYRGGDIPELEGRYVFADWSRNWILPEGVLLVGKRGGDGSGWELERWGIKGPAQWRNYIVALGEDAEGELYVLTNGQNGLAGKTGKVYRIRGVE